MSDCFVDNKLSLHLGKTESILFCSKSRLKPQSNFQISCKGTNIESKEAVKYLGTALETMAQSIIQKANPRLYSENRNFWTCVQKTLLVKPLIQCHFDYACSFWHPGLSKLLRNRLQVNRNKVIRFVLKLDPRSHIGLDEFKILGWLSVSKRVDQIILNHIFRIRSGTSPNYMRDHFISASSCIATALDRENGCFFSSLSEGLW